MDATAVWLTTEQMGLTALLLQSHQVVFHRPLLVSNCEEPSLRLRCQELFACGFPVLLSHTNAADPLLTYANASAPATLGNALGRPGRHAVTAHSTTQ